MIIFPAIDIRGGRCVRLIQGKAEAETVYSERPSEVARGFESCGAEFIHVVDLDGAFEGRRVNLETIREIVNSVNIPVQLGGGIRSLEDIEVLLTLGVSRVIIGTAAIEEKGFLREALKRFGKRIAVSVDELDGFAAVKGWTEVSRVRTMDLVKELEDMGLSTLIYTDISKDGMMSGPNLSRLELLIKNTGIDIIASGGVSSLEDVERIKKLGAYGAIIGKAIYIGQINLKDVLGVK